MPSWNIETILTAFVALTGFALLVQAIILLAVFVSMRKAVRSLREDFDDFRGSVAPFLTVSKEILERIRPSVEPVTADLARIAANTAKITASVKTASADLAEITGTLREQTAELKSTTAEAVDRVRQQAQRVDTIVTGVLDTADRAGTVVQTAINVPARHLAGILAAYKAIVYSLRSTSAKARHNGASGEGGNPDMFV